MTTRLTARLILVGLGSAAAALAFSGPVHAKGASGKGGGFYGSFATSAGAVSYNSSSGSGLAGVGWAVPGFPVVQRTGPGRGTPTYTASDRFTLGGEQLVPCAELTGTSPGCDHGGTHAAKRESYTRIMFDGAANTWTVTDTEGQRLIYSSVFNTTSGTYRWGLTRVTPLIGFDTTVGWWCDASSDCYPKTVTKNGQVTTYYWELRPKQVSFATGAGLGMTRYRLKSTSSTIGGANRGATRLTYATSTTTGRSLLSSVQSYGRDVSIDATGTITGGTTAPAMSFGYTAGPSTPFALGADVTSSALYRSGNSAATFTGDFDGNGKKDLLQINKSSNSGRVLLSNGDGTFTLASQLDDGTIESALAMITVTADFNGDGLTDILQVSQREDQSTKITNKATTGYWSKVTTEYNTDVPHECTTYGCGCTKSGPYCCNCSCANGCTPKASCRLRRDTNGKWEVRAYWWGNGTSSWIPAVAGNQVLQQDSVGYTLCTVVSAKAVPHKSQGKRARVLLSNGDGTFTVGWEILDATMFDAYFWHELRRGFLSGDWNGDGSADVLQIGHTTKRARVLLFDAQGGVTVASELADTAAFDSVFWTSEQAGSFVMDLNGDGNSDIVQIKRGSNLYRAIISNGDGTFTKAYEAYDGVQMLNSRPKFTGDWNGDGKSDMLEINNNTDRLDVFAGMGTGRLAEVADNVLGMTWRTDNAQSFVADFNGDRRDDILQIKRGSNTAKLLVSNGDGTFTKQWESGAPFMQTNSWDSVVGDFNGDGALDVAQIKNSSARVRVVHGGSSTADSLISVNNGRGGTTSVEYTPSSAWANTNNPPVVQTLTKLTVCDGRGNCSSSTAEYAGGLYDRAERQFLGFRYTKETMPLVSGETAAPYAETWFKQDYGSLAQVERSESHDGAGFLWSQTQNEYETNGSLIPYTSRRIGEWGHSYDAQGGTARTYVQTSYDAYANPLERIHYGMYDAVGDERTVRFQYAPNTSTFFVSALVATDVFEGIGTQGQLLSQAVVYYDGATDWNTPPTLGQRTKSAIWHNATGSYISGESEYDAWGNIVLERDPLGNEVRLTYDTTYHRRVVSMINPLGQTVTMAYDPVCGRQSTTDANGQVTTTTFDALCRAVRTDGPLGSWTETLWFNEGDATAQYAERRRPGPHSGPAIWTRSYTDGLGRAYKGVRKGAAAGKDVVVTRSWDARGRNTTPTRPYFEGATATSAGTPTFDSMDRIVAFTSPTGATKSFAYAPFSETQTDPMGRTRTRRRNALGKVVQTVERLGGTDVVTSYTYDVLGNLTSITDPAGNVTTMVYDSLGRRLQMSDPDTGLTSYAFDVIGRIVAQVDNKGQRTEVTYDAIGRTLTKTISAGTPQAETTSWIYDEDRPTYFNRGKMTTMVDASGTHEVNYDARGRVVDSTRTIDGASYAFATAYDGDYLQGITYPDGEVVGTTTAPLRYNEAGQPLAIPGIIDNATYDEQGRMTRRVAANGVVTDWTFDSDRAWVNQLRSAVGPTVIQDMTYQRDLMGKITQIDSPFAGESWQYAYDELDRLTSASSGTCGEATCTRCTTCGDGTCEGSENATNCATDCVAAVCGNSVCEAGETAANCDVDCTAAGLVTTTLAPTADAWVRARNTTQADTNYGTDRTLRTSSYSASAHTYLRFDLSSISATTVQSATLRVYHYRGSGGPTLDVARVPDDTWAESTITWNTKPAMGAALGSAPTGTNTWFELDVTSYVSGELADGAAGFGLTLPAGGYAWFQSREGANAPQLVVTYGGAPTQACGDGVCSAGESCDSCAQDCGQCAQQCSTTPGECAASCTTCTDNAPICSSDTPRTYTYDAIGNITSKSDVGTYTYPAPGTALPHAVTSAGGSSYTYDGNGNLLSGGGRTITWDGENRPIAINGTSFTYSGSGERLIKTTGASTTHYLGSDYEVTAGIATKYFTFAGAKVAKRTQGNTYWLHADHQGSIQSITDDTGAEVQRQSYMPYGKETATTSFAEATSFTGERLDDETGLVYLNARYYDPVLGRFTSPDLLAGVDTTARLNRYAYTLNDPVNKTDRSGMYGHLVPSFGLMPNGTWYCLCFPTTPISGQQFAINSLPGLQQSFASYASSGSPDPKKLSQIGFALAGTALRAKGYTGSTDRKALVELIDTNSKWHVENKILPLVSAGKMTWQDWGYLVNVIDISSGARNDARTIRRMKARGTAAVVVGIALAAVGGASYALFGSGSTTAVGIQAKIAVGISKAASTAVWNAIGTTAAGLLSGLDAATSLKAGVKAGLETFVVNAANVLIGGEIARAIGPNDPARLSPPPGLGGPPYAWYQPSAGSKPDATSFLAKTLGKLKGSPVGNAWIAEGSTPMTLADALFGSNSLSYWHDPLIEVVFGGVTSGATPLSDLITYSTNGMLSLVGVHPPLTRGASSINGWVEDAAAGK